MLIEKEETALISFENILIEDPVVEKKFCCDLEKCKGSCCTFPGEYGAPLLDSEVEQIEENYPKIMKYLSERSKNYIEQNGMYEGRRGSRTTVCINNRDCVFVYYDGDKALCAFEKAFLNGEIDFRKPISCHLFPIRVKHFGSPVLHYCEIDECADARECGQKNNIALIDSLRDALIRAYGAEWYNSLKKYLAESE